MQVGRIFACDASRTENSLSRKRRAASKVAWVFCRGRVRASEVGLEGAVPEFVDASDAAVLFKTVGETRLFSDGLDGNPLKIQQYTKRYRSIRVFFAKRRFWHDACRG
jgi:hypothetical protein